MGDRHWRSGGDGLQIRAAPVTGPDSDRLVDWRDFETFVRDLYARHPDLNIEHNVILVGKSGARRQIDVKFTHTAGGHTYLTLVECKHWKEKVSRDRIDVLFAGMEDLNAAKGVMFTTAGFEPGAEAYAKHKGIDLFVVRDLTDEEWGRPGRVVSFWMHYYAGQISNVRVGKDGKIGWTSIGPPPTELELKLQVGPGAASDPAATLFSVTDGSAGPNVIEVILEARRRVMAIIAREQNKLFDSGAEGATRGFVVPVALDLRLSPHRELRQARSFGRIEELSFDLLVTISQSRFRFDRGESLDFAVAVENFMTRQRQVVTKAREAADLSVFTLGDDEDRPGAPDNDVVTSYTLFQVHTEAWIGSHPLPEPAKRTARVTFSLPEWTVAVQTPAGGSIDR